MAEPSTPAPPLLNAGRTNTVAWMVFILGLLLSTALIWHLERQDQQQARALANDVATDHARYLERGIGQALAANKALAAAVAQTHGSIQAFEETARHLIVMYPEVSAMSLAPNGVIQVVVPLVGNEGVLGFNQLNSPQQQREAERARDSNQLTLAGPMPLAQGGIGIVGRMPVFLEAGKFWGFTNVTLRLEAVLKTARLERLNARGYDYVLWRVPPGSDTPQIIQAAGTTLSAATVHQRIELPNSEWMLSVMPRSGWLNPTTLLMRALAGLLFASLIGALTKLLLHLKAHEANLEQMVNQRTQQLQDAQRQLRATIDAIPDVLMELDREGHYISVHSPRPDMLAAPRDALIGKRFTEFLPEKDSRIVFNALQIAETSGWASGFRLQVPTRDGHSKWFELSVARKSPAFASEAHFIVLSRDVTERVQAEQELYLTSQVFRQSSEAIVISDAMHRIVQINPAYCRLSGFGAPEAIGQLASLDMAQSGAPSELPAEPYLLVQRTGQWEGETQGLHRNGTPYQQYRTITALRDEQGRLTHCITLFRDITQQRRDQERIRHLAHFDALTGLPNRSLLSERVTQAIQHQRTAEGCAALLFLDLDHFKNINDSLGHRVGDRVLVALARRLQLQLRPQDTVARMGGDEFVVLVYGRQMADVEVLAQKLLDSTAAPFQIDGHELTISLSIGIATYPVDGDGFDTLYQRADAAMYRAKQSGRNRYSFFTAELEARSARTLHIANALRRALEREQFALHYQPQLDTHTKAVIGAEALIRWYHPELGQVSPAEFIPIAESTGLIIGIGDWVMRTAAQDMRRWLDMGITLRTVSVNLSPLQFQHHHLPEQVARNLAHARLPAQHLMLELTESAAVDDPAAAIAMLDRLNRQGVRIALDDFGTGYSSLSYLKRFQIHKLKIDQSFVRDLEQDANDRAIIVAIIHIAKALGMDTLAEGVESEAQLDFLQAQGCNFVQGYLFSRPLPAPQFEALLLACTPAS
ncbi:MULTISPECIES: bifunctional diguanylate cyclase/phosphodiesterase [Comamonas]|uniref:bifunctional diguanylate cyclase/phosphodiesterase n=1 Tax=Comamonas TaxID=283 RepID=UPI0023578A38|nr:EAL domain-containing protein [Comamonas terrigena]MDH1292400.1 EAL domain-containing protein [Comamonas terrigena]